MENTGANSKGNGLEHADAPLPASVKGTDGLKQEDSHASELAKHRVRASAASDDAPNPSGLLSIKRKRDSQETIRSNHDLKRQKTNDPIEKPVPRMTNIQMALAQCKSNSPLHPRIASTEGSDLAQAAATSMSYSRDDPSIHHQCERKVKPIDKIGRVTLAQQSDHATTGLKRKRESANSDEFNDQGAKLAKAEGDAVPKMLPNNMFSPAPIGRLDEPSEVDSRNKAATNTEIAQGTAPAGRTTSMIDVTAIDAAHITRSIIPGLPGWVPAPSDSGYESLGSSTSSQPRSGSSVGSSPAVSPPRLNDPDPHLPSHNQQTHDPTTTSRTQHLPPAKPSSAPNSS